MEKKHVLHFHFKGRREKDRAKKATDEYLEKNRANKAAQRQNEDYREKEREKDRARYATDEYKEMNRKRMSTGENKTANLQRKTAKKVGITFKARDGLKSELTLTGKFGVPVNFLGAMDQVSVHSCL